MSTKVTYQNIMDGVWGRSGRRLPTKSNAGCSPRGGGVPIRLLNLSTKLTGSSKHWNRIDKKEAFKLLLSQQKG